MSVSRTGLLGDLKGKLGKVVIYQRNGQTIVRSNPPRKAAVLTEGLSLARHRFARVQKVIRAIKPFSDIGYRDAADDSRAPYRVAMSANLIASRNANDNDDLLWLLPSQGYRAGAMDINMSVSGKQATITWGDPVAYAPSGPDDLAIILAINTTTLLTNNLNPYIKRSHQQATITLPDALPGENILVYIFFYDEQGGLKQNNLSNISQAQQVIVAQ